uniref:Guanylate cyclase n=1 Tax=Esox lucius TaxID=8010 RepID=A0A3P8YNI4_ESOLU
MRPLLNGWWLLGAWLWLLGVPGIWAMTYKIALIGPWTCDILFSRALPRAAVNLALSRLNKDPRLKGGYWYDVKLLTESCSSSHGLADLAGLKGYGHAYLGPFNPALCSAASLYAIHWEAGLLSPGCLNTDRKTQVSLPPITPPSHILFTILRFFRWAHVAVVSVPSDLWEATGEEVASSLRGLGLPVGPVITMEMKKEGPRATLRTIMEADKVKVVIMCMSSVLVGGEEQRDLLLTALDMDMVSDGYVFLPYDTLLYALPYQDTAFSGLANQTRLLRQAYDAVVTVTMDSEENFYDTYRQAQKNHEIKSRVPAEEVSPLFGTIYNMVYFAAMAIEERRQSKGGQWVTGDDLGQSEGGFEFQGFNQVISGGEKGKGMQTRYVVLDSDGGEKLLPTHTLDPSQTYTELRPLARSIYFPGGKPPSSSYCWFSSETACRGGDVKCFANLYTQTSNFCSLSPLCHSPPFSYTLPLCFFLCGRKRGKGIISKRVLTLDNLVFINANASRRKLNEESIMRSLLEVRTPLRSLSGCCYIPATPESSNVCILEVTHTLYMLREMRHENVNLYLGLFLDAGIFAIVMDHCPRGSLFDILANPNMRLDWMFKSSLLTDLIKGMKYLHTHGLSHGRLKSRNCLVDGRFVLKVSDYGYSTILNSQKLSPPEEPEDLLWTAPELLRRPQQGGSFPGDVYSFAIIIQEVILRSAPYAMMDMPAKEIIDRVRCPPPLCRPCVNLEEAPLECITLMKESWDEKPERRPTFQEIFTQFHSVNKGKRANIIDSMLRMLEQYSSNLEDLIRERTDELEVERNKTEKLVGQLLPRSVAQALKKGKPVQPEHYSDCTLYFSDIVGFTTISALSEPIEVVDLLNDLYTTFDAIIAFHDVYKVETIGDAYMCASGVPNRNGNRHAAEMSNMSLDILHAIGNFRIKHMPDVKVKIRIGLHSGPVVAGVVGLTMPRYCLFGDTVTTASLMESSGLPYRIHLNVSTVKILQSLNQGYKFATRAKDIKVKDSQDTYWLLGRDGFTKPLPVPPDLSPGASNHGISLDEIPADRRQKFLDRQNKNKQNKK